MRSSEKGIKFVIAVIFMVLIIILLDLTLYPCTFMRNDIHAVTTESFDDIYLGTSHGKMGIDPDVMEEVSGRKGHNLCVGGEYTKDAYYLAKLIKETQDVDRIIYEIDPKYFVSEKEEGNNYLLIYHEFPISKAKLEYFNSAIKDRNLRTVLFPWYEYSLKDEILRVSDTLYQKLNKNYDVSYFKGSIQEYHESGFLERYTVNTDKLEMGEQKVFYRDQVNEETLYYLTKLIDFCEENGIDFVAVTTPVPIETLSTYEENFKEAWEFFGSYFKERAVRYFNFNTGLFKAFPHDIKYFTDYDGHLNGPAAESFSKLLAQVLKKETGK